MQHDHFIAGVRSGSLYSGHALVESFFDKPCKKLWRYESNGVLIRSTVEPDPQGSAMITRDVCYAKEVGEMFNFKLVALPIRTITVDTETKKQKRITCMPWDNQSLKLWVYSRCAASGFMPLELGVYAAWATIDRKGIHWQKALASYEGRLKVTDLEAFNRTLTEGMSGSDKAFGCSLLTISPITK